MLVLSLPQCMFFVNCVMLKKWPDVPRHRGTVDSPVGHNGHHVSIDIFYCILIYFIAYQVGIDIYLKY